MTKLVRYLSMLVSAAQFVFAIAYFLQLPFATSLWPFQGTTPLTFIFIASFLAAGAVPTLWAAVSENYGALAGIGLDYLTTMTPASIFLFQLGASSGNPQMTASGIPVAFAALFGLVLLLWSSRIHMDRTLAMPTLVRWSFVIFIISLLTVSALLISKTPNIIPWKITPELSVAIGWMFLGSSTYFLYGLLRPGWLNAVGQLASFLAYDVVLFIPLFVRLPTVAPEQRISLIIYLIVIAYSGLLAIYYLFIHRSTRLWASPTPRLTTEAPLE